MSRDDGGAFVSGLLWLPTLNNYNPPTPLHNKCGMWVKWLGEVNQPHINIYSRPVLHLALNLPHNRIKILIPEFKTDGWMDFRCVQGHKHVLFNVTGVNISVVPYHNLKPLFVVLTSNPAASHDQSI